MKDEHRDTGRTTAQIKLAPKNAVFVWCASDTHYPRQLASAHGRTDLEIVGRSWLSGNMVRGRELTGLVLDHACDLSPSEFEGYLYAVSRVRRTINSKGTPEALDSGKTGDSYE